MSEKANSLDDVGNVTKIKFGKNLFSGADSDTRKVEPLKINLNRNESGAGSTAGFNEVHIVPKLTIRSNDGTGSPISVATTHSIVPKLTIKMDSNTGSGISTSNACNRGGGVSEGVEEESKVPKITVKTGIGENNHAVIIRHDGQSNRSAGHELPQLPKITIKASKPTEINFESLHHSNKEKLTVRQIEEEHTSLERVPKLMISRENNHNLVPKVIINCSKNEIVAPETSESNKKVAKLTIKATQDNSLVICNNQKVLETMTKIVPMEDETIEISSSSCSNSPSYAHEFQIVTLDTIDTNEDISLRNEDSTLTENMETVETEIDDSRFESFQYTICEEIDSIQQPIIPDEEDALFIDLTSDLTQDKSKSTTDEQENFGFTNLRDLNDEGGPIVRKRGRPRKKGSPLKSAKKGKSGEQSEDPSNLSFQELNEEAIKRRRSSFRGRNRGGGSMSRKKYQAKHRSSLEKLKGFQRQENVMRNLNTDENMLQIFEEETRMSGDLAPPIRELNDFNNDDTQNSISSETSCQHFTISSEASAQNFTAKKKKRKTEAVTMGATDYTVSLIAEYDWPPPKGCCPSKTRETYMIQEQIAMFLGIKSFKRKYPDLFRRQIDMEERNYLQEKGYVSEKLCDLGITAVYASDILDIMYCDFYEKYEEYKNYLRQKHIHDREIKMKSASESINKRGLPARQKAILSATQWNASFNKMKKETIDSCFDLQNLVQHVKSPFVLKNGPQRLNFGKEYPISLVPGQFSDVYTSFDADTLSYYPLNTCINNQFVAMNNINDKYIVNKLHINKYEDDNSSDNETNDSSEDDKKSTSSSSEEEEQEIKKKCAVCHQMQNKNKCNQPEMFIKCYSCNQATHPSCIEMTKRMFTRCKSYNWQCADCKCCVKCKQKQDVNKMLFCEQCDRGFHIYCLNYKVVPDGRWNCERCSICMNCGSNSPEGLRNSSLMNSKQIKHKKVKWINEYRIDHVTKLREHCSILCVPCGRFKTNNKNYIDKRQIDQI